MNETTLLDHAFAWASDRIAQITPDDLAAPTPCDDWTLAELLDHTVATLAMLTDAVAPVEVPSGDGATHSSGSWGIAIAQLADRSREAWSMPGVMERSFELPFGELPAAALVLASTLEMTIHGWDVSQATGEAAAIPDALAAPILEFACQAIDDSQRGVNFGPDRGAGGSPSDRLIAFLGRTPL